MSKIAGRVVGWDMGGAHLKAVLFQDGSLAAALQLPCELWRGLDRLEDAIRKVLETFGIRPPDAEHAITMTGELVDLFANRYEGVQEISSLASSMLTEQAKYYAAGTGFVPLEEVVKRADAIASANWHASASLLAKYIPDTLFIDIGSTTTDIIPIVENRVANIGLSDTLRMQEDTLVYTGVVRTPVMALAQKLPFDGAVTNVVAEHFSTMADVYRLLGELPHGSDIAETADGKGKSLLESARRLARMIGCDVEVKSLDDWKQLAVTCKTLQLEQIKMAALRHLRPNTPIVGVGAGEFLVKSLAIALKCPYIRMVDVLQIENVTGLSVCFPAYAVARLAQMRNPVTA